jgi:hypothetical protein
MVKMQAAAAADGTAQVSCRGSRPSIATTLIVESIA